MNSPIPQYKENEFLIALLNQYQKEHGDEIRHFDTFEFHSLNAANPLCEIFPKFAAQGDEAFTATFQPWLEEAKARGHVIDKTNNKLIYCFTEAGFNEAIKHKHPIKHFYKKHWQWFWGTALTIVNLIASAIWTLWQC